MSIFPQNKNASTEVRRELRSAFHHPWVWLASGLGAGLSPWAPGTVGTLWGIPLYYGIATYCPDYLWPITISLALLGCWICHQASRYLATPDHPGIVWDEICGYLVTVAGISGFSWENALIAFCLFRVFDILKPWPIRWIDHHCPGGVGIMMDDIIAAGYAAFALSFWKGWLMVG